VPANSALSLANAVLVVTHGVSAKLTPHGFQLQRNQIVRRTLVLHGAHQALNHCNTSLLTDSTKPRTDGAAVTPTFEGVAPELPTLVGDDVLGRAPGVTDRSTQKSLNVTSRWMIAEDGEADVPDFTGTPGRHDLRLDDGERGSHIFRNRICLPQDPSHGRHTEV
jgi:hypothetical protein